MELDKLQEFLQWCLIVNLIVYIISFLAVLTMRGFMGRMHKLLFGVSEETADRVMYQYIAFYKLLLIVFSLVPWIAIQIIN